MAVAPGFDVPRAWTLVSMRATRDEDFGVQIVGRILRVHRRLQGRLVPDALRYGYVMLADFELQGGLDAAGQRINKIKTAYATVSPTTMFVNAGGNLMVQSAEQGGQLVMNPQPPQGAVYEEPPAAILDERGNVDPHQLEMFATRWPPEMPAALALVKSMLPKAKRESYPSRDDVPRRFKTQDLPEEQEVTEEEVADKFTADVEALYEATEARADVKVLKRTLEIFTQVIQNEFSFAPPSMEEKQRQAQRTLLGYRTLSAKVLREALARRLQVMLTNKGFEFANDRTRLHECLDELLWQRPALLRDAYKGAIAAKAIVYAAEELPATLESDSMLAASKHNVYNRFPPMGGWERAFAEYF